MGYHESRASDVLQAVREFVVIDESTNPMLRPLSGVGGFCLRVRESGRGEFARHEIDAPFAVIGRSSKSDIFLSGSGVSYRHAYLQVLSGRLFCVDLGSKTGLYWGKRRRAYGWLAPEETLKIGSHKLALETRAESPAIRTDDECGEVPLDADKSRVDQLPGYLLEIWDGSDEPKCQPVDRVLSLVGRWSSCPVHLPDESVSRVHCSFVLTESGLWVIDLLGKNGMTINQNVIRAALLEHGDKVRIGKYTIRVHQREIADDLHDIDPGEEQGAHTCDQAELQETPELVGESTTQPAVDESVGIDTALWESDPHASDWMGSLFHIEHLGNTLVVLPNISGGTFRYAQLQAESNSLRRMLDNPAHHSLIVDLQGFNYIGSEAIGVLIGLARRATDRGGRVAFCHASPNVQTVMQNMGLLRLWPYFATRDEALSDVSAE